MFSFLSDLFFRACTADTSDEPEIYFNQEHLSALPAPVKFEPIEKQGVAAPNEYPPLAPHGWPDWELDIQSKHFRKSAAGKASPTRQALNKLHDSFPFFALPGHYLNKPAKECLECLSLGDNPVTKEAFERLKDQVEYEEHTVEVLYQFFMDSLYQRQKQESAGLRKPDIEFMLRFLGYPTTKPSVLKFIDAVDTDRDFLLNKKEFRQFVGRMGGTFELIEYRKKLRSGRSGLLDAAESFKAAETSAQEIQKACGIGVPEQTFWRLVRARSELQALQDLKPCQQNALREVRARAKVNHEKALPKLQDRLKRLGFTGMEMEATFAWIREVPPIIIQVDLGKFSSYFLNDTHYRNQFETNVSGALNDQNVRTKWESDLFKKAYDEKDVRAFDRCKYGCLNITNDYRGVAGTEGYGQSYLVLKDVRLRCTFSPQDSANLKTDDLAVADYFAHQLVRYTDSELTEVVKLATSSETVLGSSTMMKYLKYKEAQIHGEVAFARHIDRLVAHDSHNTSYWPDHLKEICAKHGWKFSWMCEERKRVEKEEARRSHNATFWKERLTVKLDEEEIANKMKAYKLSVKKRRVSVGGKPKGASSSDAKPPRKPLLRIPSQNSKNSSKKDREDSDLISIASSTTTSSARKTSKTRATSGEHRSKAEKPPAARRQIS
eukprot:TRINITY_DN105859_c0_g1_i1.p1 TRINITY_DN105859_c0_g1~~TRINITY_DN105859_c0_g1_i1.p1  ORF type:complete len:663 (+),score=135.12 TRINITY_DN105859_c0_g1_i1:71-2059(+)